MVRASTYNETGFFVKNLVFEKKKKKRKKNDVLVASSGRNTELNF